MPADYLTEDSILPSDQKYVCLSFLSDVDNNSSLKGIKVRGVFSTYESACSQAKTLQSADPSFHVFVGEVGKWLPFDPSPDSANESEYANEQLNDMMKSYMENQEKAKIYHEHRKNDMIRKNIIDNLTSRNENLDELKNKLNETKNPDELHNLKINIKSTEENIKSLEEKKKELDKQINDLNKQINSFPIAKPNSLKLVNTDDSAK